MLNDGRSHAPLDGRHALERHLPAAGRRDVELLQVLWGCPVLRIIAHQDRVLAQVREPVELIGKAAAQRVVRLL